MNGCGEETRLLTYFTRKIIIKCKTEKEKREKKIYGKVLIKSRKKIMDTISRTRRDPGR